MASEFGLVVFGLSLHRGPAYSWIYTGAVRANPVPALRKAAAQCHLSLYLYAKACGLPIWGVFLVLRRVSFHSLGKAQLHCPLAYLLCFLSFEDIPVPCLLTAGFPAHWTVLYQQV